MREIFAREPAQDDAMGLCMRAWSDLSTCRPVGMTAGPVPWTAAMEWCRWHGLDHDASAMVWAVIRRLDRNRAEAEGSKP